MSDRVILGDPCHPGSKKVLVISTEAHHLRLTLVKDDLNTQWPNDGCHCSLRPLCLLR